MNKKIRKSIGGRKIISKYMIILSKTFARLPDLLIIIHLILDKIETLMTEKISIIRSVEKD